MLDKKISTINFLTTGILLLIIGILILLKQSSILTTFIVILGYIFLVRGIINLIVDIIRKKEKKFISIVSAIIEIIFGVICINNKYFVLITTARIFAVYLFLISITHFINYSIYIKFKIKGRITSFIKFITTFILSLAILINPHINVKYLSIILGIYTILYGMNSLTNFLSEILPISSKNKIKRSINIQLPIVLTAFIPVKLITLINELLENEDDTTTLNLSKGNKTSDLEVLIHLAPNGSAAMGHVEVAFKDKVYSYGNYDQYSRKLFDAIGDGVILIANKGKYINYCIEKRQRFIVEFGISLTDYEKLIVEERINDLISTNTIDYYSDSQLADMGKIPKEDFHDMSSEIYEYAEGKYKKIVSGKYKKFFVLKNNCVMVAQHILSSVGKEILAINGIISPGAYYDYLNKRFLMKNTNIISRKIYNKKNKFEL